MGASTPTKIHLKGSGRHDEGTAGGTITPGHLIMLNSSNQYVVHDNVQAHAERIFAVEDALQGAEIDDDYSSADLVSMVIANRGDEIYAWLAGAELAVIGSQLTSAGDGTLQVADDSDVAQVRLAVALEAVDQSESDEVAARIKIRIM